MRRLTRLPWVAIVALAGVWSALSTHAALAGETEDLSLILESSRYLGKPTGRVTAVAGGRYQAFEGGHVYETPEGEFFGVEGGSRSPILATYLRMGGAGGRLGFPIEEAPLPGTTHYARTQRFQFGAITALSPTHGDWTLWEVPAPVAFNVTRGDAFPTTLRLTWMNRGAPETVVVRKVNGGPDEYVQSYGALADGTFTAWVDPSPPVNAKVCYYVFASDGFYTAATATRCAFTRDGLSGANYRVSRAQVRVKLSSQSPQPPMWVDYPVQVILQSPTGLNLPLPTGNKTWVDSSVDDFLPGSERTYDLMTRNVTYVSDITLLSIKMPAGDGLCIEEVELLVNGRSVFQKSYGGSPTTCAWTANGSSVYVASFEELRASPTWPNGTTVVLPSFPGFRAAGFRSLLEAKFANLLHPEGGHLRNGDPVFTKRIDDERLYVDVDFIGADGGSWGDIACEVHFSLVIHPSEDEEGRYRFRIADQVVDCGWDWIPLIDTFVNIAFEVVPVWEYSVDAVVEKALANAGGANLGVPPLGGRFCFPTEGSGAVFSNFEDGGITVCQ